MPERHAISFATAAVDDLQDILDWYRAQQVPDVGERLVREVVQDIERLVELPESGRIVPEFGAARLREIIHPPFRIVYRLEEARVRVVRVWRSERMLKVPPPADVDR
jgi:plasmid stabilization system protein ParE